MAKKFLAPLIFVVIVLVIAGLLLVSRSPHTQTPNNPVNLSVEKPIAHTQEEINSYKRALFESLDCQYNCKPENVTMNNETRFLPDPTCVKACTDALKAKHLPASTEFNQTELIQDNLFKDIEAAHANCTTSNTNQSSGERFEVTFFTCMSDKLRQLKTQYPYL